MPTTIRQYRIVKPMRFEEAVLYLAGIAVLGPARKSLVIMTQRVDDPHYQTYSYECYSLERALEILQGMSWTSDWMTRVEWM